MHLLFQSRFTYKVIHDELTKIIDMENANFEAKLTGTEQPDRMKAKYMNVLIELSNMLLRSYREVVDYSEI